MKKGIGMGRSQMVSTAGSEKGGNMRRQEKTRRITSQPSKDEEKKQDFNKPRGKQDTRANNQGDKTQEVKQNNTKQGNRL